MMGRLSGVLGHLFHYLSPSPLKDGDEGGEVVHYKA